MCGPCGTPDEHFSSVRVEPPPTLSMNQFMKLPYHKFQVTDINKWKEWSDAQGLKAVYIGNETLGMAPGPEFVFQVHSNDRVFYYRREDALKVAQEILRGAPPTSKEEQDKRITELCNAIKTQAEVQSTSVPAAGIMKKIDGLDVEINNIFESVDREFSKIKKDKDKTSEGIPGAYLLQAYKKLGERKAFVNELRKLQRPEPEVALMTHKGQRLFDRFDFLSRTLNFQLSDAQKKIMGNVVKGEIRDKDPHLFNAFTTKRSVEDMANETRPILVNAIARSVIFDDPPTKELSEAVEKIKKEKTPVWAEIITPDGKFNAAIDEMMNIFNAKTLAQTHQLENLKFAREIAEPEGLEKKRDAMAKEGEERFKKQYKTLMGEGGDDPFKATPTTDKPTAPISKPAPPPIPPKTQQQPPPPPPTK